MRRFEGERADLTSRSVPFRLTTYASANYKLFNTLWRRLSKTASLLLEGGGLGTESHGLKITWFSINYSILSGVAYQKLPPYFWKEVGYRPIGTELRVMNRIE